MKKKKEFNMQLDPVPRDFRVMIDESARDYGEREAYIVKTKRETSTEPAEYDAACLENAELLLGTTGTETRGRLAPLEAVIYEAVSPE